MGERIPIATFPGYVAGLFEYDLILVPAGASYTVKTLFLQRTEAPSGGETVTASVRNATDGGGSGFAVSLTGTATENSASGTLEVSASETLYLRVTAGDSSLNLHGWVELETTSTAAVSAALTSLVRVKEFLGISASTWDTQLNNHISEVSNEIQSWLGRAIVETTSTGERFSHDGRSESLITTGYPIISVTSISEDGTALVADTGYEVTERDKRIGSIVRISGGDATSWTAGTRHIVATYAHGFSSVPAGVIAAATRLIAFDFRESQPGGARFGLDGKALDTGGASGYRTRSDVWAAIRPALDGYRRRL